jgi:hypothetical protein
MNERFRQLAEQAEKTYTYKDFSPDGGEVTKQEKTVDLEKFAELIVRECVTMCEETQAGYFKHRKAADDFQDKNIYAEGEAACDVIKYKMKKHFGVEE